MEAITHDKFVLLLGAVSLSVLKLEIKEEFGRHGTLSADASAGGDMKEYLLYESGVSVTLQGESKQLLFCGMLTQMEVKNQGSQCIVHIEAVTGSYQMDMGAGNSIFQDTALTCRQLLKKILKPYTNSKLKFSITDKKLGQIAVQYQETDWEFISRVLSWYGAGIWVISTMHNIHLKVGLTDTETKVDWDKLPYSAVRDTAPKEKKGGVKSHICYKTEAYEFLTLGEKVRFHGKELYIGKIERCIDKGTLVNKYSLYFKEGFIVSRYGNPYLGGISVNGIVKEVKRNKIQACLQFDALKECKSQYFFPFSTVAASPDGSGWYCMPKKGDMIRVFFPTEDEGQGYAIANVMGQSAPSASSPISNPDLKDITAPDGKAMKFIQGGIQLSVGKEKGVVKLTNDGTAEIKTDEDIEICAAEMISFSTEEEGKIEVTAGTQITIESDSGCSISMTKEEVEINAVKIESN
ncbi:MAG: phage late control D family protein [Roseburia sp.]|nr:phage late control D family protein [Roseburia sp.]